MNEAVATISRWIEKGKRHYVCVGDVHGVVECQRNEMVMDIHNQSGLTVSDGMPLVWLGRLKGFSKMSRIYGPDLMLKLCEVSVKEKYTHFLYGGNVGVAGRLRDWLSKRLPGIRIVGFYTPPFQCLNSEEEAQLIETVSHLKPDIIWVDLSTPKQELLMSEYISKLDTKVMLGVGAAFDVHTGRIKHAPTWMKKVGMQWFHRISQKPQRLWRCYLRNNPLFAYKVLQEVLKNNFFNR